MSKKISFVKQNPFLLGVGGEELILEECFLNNYISNGSLHIT